MSRKLQLLAHYPITVIIIARHLFLVIIYNFCQWTTVRLLLTFASLSSVRGFSERLLWCIWKITICQSESVKMAYRCLLILFLHRLQSDAQMVLTPLAVPATATQYDALLFKKQEKKKKSKRRKRNNLTIGKETRIHFIIMLVICYFSFRFILIRWWALPQFSSSFGCCILAQATLRLFLVAFFALCMRNPSARLSCHLEKSGVNKQNVCHFADYYHSIDRRKKERGFDRIARSLATVSSSTSTKG